MTMSDASSDDLWRRVAVRLDGWSAKKGLFKYGQDDSLRWVARRLPENGVILADEVGLGKTRIALMTLFATMEEGGTAAVVVPPGLMYQWKKEADDTVRSLMDAGCVTKEFRAPPMLRTYHSLFSHASGNSMPYPLANGSERRWCLISHAFDMYNRIRKVNSWAQGLELPYLVKARREQLHGRHLVVQFLKRRGLIDVLGQDDPDLYLLAEALAGRYLAGLPNQDYSKDILELFGRREMRSPRTDGYRLKESAFFQKNSPGRRLLMRLGGMLVGKVDLLIVDEAHKARSDETRLGLLLSDILRFTNNPRRMSMTATPIELSADQWFSLLRRTGVDGTHLNWNRIEQVIPEFSAALWAVRATPGNPTVVKQLLESAKAFEDVLKPFVSRRMRINQKDMMQLLPTDRNGGAQPHRRYIKDGKNVRIAIQELDDDWRRMVMALEGQGLAGKGCANVKHKDRQIDIRYSSGLDCDFLTGDSEADSPEMPAKERRYLAWSRYLAGAAKQKTGGDWLRDHPRIIRAAALIESLCDFDRIHPKEKILVFGRYSRPIAMLNQTLNLRYTLRLLDHGTVGVMPIRRGDDPALASDASDNGDASRLEHLFFLYRKGLETGEYSGLLKDSDWSPEQLIRSVEATAKRYESLRDRLQRQFNRDRLDWVAAQPGDAVIQNLRIFDEGTYGKLFAMLRSDVLDRLRDEEGERLDTSREMIDKYAHEAWVRHLRCALHDRDRDEEESDARADVGATPYTGEDAELQELDADGDRLTPQRLAAYIDNHRRSDFSRLLNGGLPHSTKQAVQESFNQFASPPHVLIAQSMVGREGLNLHRQCRRVVLFHPEWNPGILEQQIGRVDRIESKWVKMAENHKGAAGNAEDYPYIEIYPLIFQGTYDEYQAGILFSRRELLNAQLFGELLDAATMDKIPSEHRESMKKAAPCWEPCGGNQDDHRSN